MKFTLSTSYFAGKALTQKDRAVSTKEMGFDGVELGYYLRDEDWVELKTALKAENLFVSSVHAFAPVLLNMPQLGPEMYSIADTEKMERDAALQQLRNTLNLAADAEAEVVVMHGGRVPLQPKWWRGPTSEENLRVKNATKLFKAITESLEEILPEFKSAGVKLALENLPGIDAFPSSEEFLKLAEIFPDLYAWHDIGHGELRQRCGIETVNVAMTNTKSRIAGFHIHDVIMDEPQNSLLDHCAPGTGCVVFEYFSRIAQNDEILKVFEPAQNVKQSDLIIGLEYMKKAWNVKN